MFFQQEGDPIVESEVKLRKQKEQNHNHYLDKNNNFITEKKQ